MTPPNNELEQVEKRLGEIEAGWEKFGLTSTDRVLELRDMLRAAIEREKILVEGLNTVKGLTPVSFMDIVGNLSMALSTARDALAKWKEMVKG